MSFVERHGLWSAEQKEAAKRLARHRRGEEARNHPPVVCRPARHPARQDADRKRGARLARKRLRHHHLAAGQGHLAQDGLPGVHRRRRLRHEGDGRRRRRADGAGSRRRSACCRGRRHRAGCCATSISATASRCRSRRGSSIAPCVNKLGERGYDFVAGLEVEFHLFKLDDAHMAAGGCRPARPAAFGQPALAWLSISGRAALRPDRAGARHHPPRYHRARPAAALGRGRIRPEPVRVHLCAEEGHRARRQHDAVPQRREADRAPPRLSRHLHVPAEAAERVRLRLASASIAGVARATARTRSWRTTATRS